MPLTETLFGGLLAVVALFFLARRFGLSHYWSAVLSGALPFLAYLGYSAKDWPGGDVLAIHLVVFMATSGVLGVFGSVQRRKEPMHWAPKLLIAFFASLVVFNAVLLSIATHGLPDSVAAWFMPHVGHQTMHTAFPGAVPHDRNRLYEPHLQRVEQQRQLGWQVDAKSLEQLRRGVAADVRIAVSDKAGQPLDGVKVTLGLWRMANSLDDRRLELAPVGAGNYGVNLALPDAGYWIAEVYIERGEDSYLVQHPITVAE